MTDAEYAALEARARASNLTLSERVRDVLLASSPEAGAEAADHVLLAELLGLRTILINLLFSIGKGEPATAEQMQELIEPKHRFFVHVRWGSALLWLERGQRDEGGQEYGCERESRGD